MTVSHAAKISSQNSHVTAVRLLADLIIMASAITSINSSLIGHGVSCSACPTGLRLVIGRARSIVAASLMTEAVIMYGAAGVCLISGVDLGRKRGRGRVLCSPAKRISAYASGGHGGSGVDGAISGGPCPSVAKDERLMASLTSVSNLARAGHFSGFSGMAAFAISTCPILTVT